MLRNSDKGILLQIVIVLNGQEYVPMTKLYLNILIFNIKILVNYTRESDHDLQILFPSRVVTCFMYISSVTELYLRRQISHPQF